MRASNYYGRSACDCVVIRKAAHDDRI